MAQTTVIFFILNVLLSALIATTTLSVGGAIAIVVIPLALLAFWKKPTLKSSQTIFSVVFALALGCLMLFVGNNALTSRQFYAIEDKWFFVAYLGILFVSATILSTLCFVTKQHYRLFVFGVICAVACCCVPQTSVVLCAICFSLIIFAMGFVLASIAILQQRLKEATKIVEVKNVSWQLLLRNLAFVATAVNLFFALTMNLCSPKGLEIAQISSNIAVAVLLVVLQFTYLRQPLDFVTEHKMQIWKEKPADTNLTLVKLQIYQRLCEVQNYPPAMFLKKLLGIFIRCKTEGLENVKQTAACFIANHYEIYGPFITVLKFPLVFMPWTDSLITEKKHLVKQLRSGVEIATKKWLIKPLRRKLPETIASPLWKTVNCARPIPVYRSGSDEIEKMFTDSVTALQTGDSVVIYPEKPPKGSNYKIGGVDKFQTGFVEIADYYKRETGVDMCFYPLYIDKVGKKMIIGEPVTFNSENAFHEEKLRIAEELFLKMDAMFQECERNHKKTK